MSVCGRPAFGGFAAERSAPVSLPRRRSVPSRFALRRIAPLRFAPLRSLRERSVPVRSARAPPSLPRKKRSCASRISARVFPLCLILFGFLSPIVPPQIGDFSLIFYWKWQAELHAVHDISLLSQPPACDSVEGVVSDFADRSRGAKVVTNLRGGDARILELRGCLG